VRATGTGRRNAYVWTPYMRCVRPRDMAERLVKVATIEFSVPDRLA
jgi:hypothetical protein